MWNISITVIKDESEMSERHYNELKYWRLVTGQYKCRASSCYINLFEYITGLSTNEGGPGWCGGPRLLALYNISNDLVPDDSW